MTSAAKRTLTAGAICISILCGMLVTHAMPLWTGTTVVLPVIPIDPRDLFRGEYVRLDTPAEALATGELKESDRAFVVRGVGDGWNALPADSGQRRRELFGSLVYVQLEPQPGGTNWAPVSVSLEPVPGGTNLRGRIGYGGDLERGLLHVDYGLDRYYMEEGTARPVEDALRTGKRVQMEVAVASDGRSRIRRLLVDGVPHPQ